MYKRAQDAASQGDLSSAREQLDSGASPRRHARRGAHACSASHWASRAICRRAISHLERAIALQPESAEAHYISASRSGTAASKTDALDRAAEERRRSIPRRARATRFSARRCANRATSPGARASLQRAIALLPPTAAVYVDLGITFLRAGKLDNARGAIRSGAERSRRRRAPRRIGPAPLPLSGRRLATNAAIAPTARNVLGLLLGPSRRRQQARSPPRSARPIRLRPDYAEAHNNLGLVLHSGRRRRARHRRACARRCASPRLRRGARESRSGADADRRRGSDSRAGEGRRARAELGQGAIQSRPSAYGASAEPRAGEGDRAAAEGDRRSLRRSRGRTSRSARRCSRTGQIPQSIDELTGGREAGTEQRRVALSAWARAGAGGTQGGGRGRAPEGAGARRRRRSQPERESRHRRRARGAGERRSGARSDQVPARHPAPARIVRSAPPSRGRPGEARRPGRRHRRLPKGARTESSGRVRERTSRKAGDGRDRRGRSRASGATRRLHSRGQVRGGRSRCSPTYVKERPTSSWGWYALGYSRFAQQKIGESIEALAKSLELDVRNAEAHKILGRDLMIIGRFDAAQHRVRAGASATSRTPPRFTTTSASCFPCRTTGSRRERRSSRRCASIRRTSRRWTRSASRWRRWATTSAPSRRIRRRLRSTRSERAHSRRRT